MINFDELKKFPNIWIKKYPDAIYFGQVNMSNMHWEGKGIMKYKNGRVYEGHFKYDLRDGKGYEKY